MKKRVGLLICVAALLAGVCAPALSVETSGGTAYVSKYIWRGFDLGPADEDAVQTSITIAWNNGASLNIWGSYAMDGDMQLDEHDYTLGYATSLSGNVDLSAGYTHYTFPSVVTGTETQTESTEAYLGFSFPNVVLKPAVTVYEDMEAGDGTYIYVSGGTDFAVELGARPQLFSFKAGAGYNNGQWAPVSGLSNIDLSLSTTFKSGTVAITPSVNYTLNQEDAVNTEDEFWFGVNCGFGL